MPSGWAGESEVLGRPQLSGAITFQAVGDRIEWRQFPRATADPLLFLMMSISALMFLLATASIMVERIFK